LEKDIHTLTEQTHTGLQQPVICHYDLELFEIRTHAMLPLGL